MNPEDNIEPVAPTQDMRLPEGSAVVQAIITRDPNGGGTLDVRCVLIGTDVYDPVNPAHRFVLAIQNRISEIMLEVTGEPSTPVDGSDIEQRLAEAQCREPAVDETHRKAEADDAADAQLARADRRTRAADDEAHQQAAPTNAAQARERLIEGLVKSGHGREYAETLVDAIALDPEPVSADDTRALEK